MKNTTSRTLFVWTWEAPRALRGTEKTEKALFARKGSEVVMDFGGDPAEWMVATSDHIMSLASDDTDGFQILKGGVSVNRLREAPAHVWKQFKTLAKFLEDADHPLNATGHTLEELRAAYNAYRVDVLGIDAA